MEMELGMHRLGWHKTLSIRQAATMLPTPLQYQAIKPIRAMKKNPSRRLPSGIRLNLQNGSGGFGQ